MYYCIGCRTTHSSEVPGTVFKTGFFASKTEQAPIRAGFCRTEPVTEPRTADHNPFSCGNRRAAS
ncbi:DUF3973 domain-containing protein [Paenibacillus hamazuiensis]|uniref:DUF3973 domain-containing protein n=1 Tax=Paenibacillus hamazuiensis TaxID=2936508 RepID=UPI003B8472BD